MYTVDQNCFCAIVYVHALRMQSAITLTTLNGYPGSSGPLLLAGDLVCLPKYNLLDNVSNMTNVHKRVCCCLNTDTCTESLSDEASQGGSFEDLLVRCRILCFKTSQQIDTSTHFLPRLTPHRSQSLAKLKIKPLWP